MASLNLKVILGKILTTIMFDFLLDGKLNDPMTFLNILEEAKQAVREKYNIME